MSDPRVALAWQLFQEAYEHQMSGSLELAESLYKRSIELYPTAEAYTFLGGPTGTRERSTRRSMNARMPF